MNKQLKNCKLSRNGRARKDTPTRVVGIITVNIHPTVYLQATGFYEKMCRGACILSLPLLFVYFFYFILQFFSYFYGRHLRHLSPDASHDCVSCFDGYTCLLILILCKNLIVHVVSGHLRLLCMVARCMGYAPGYRHWYTMRAQAWEWHGSNIRCTVLIMHILYQNGFQQ